jgi:hypothetical protein
MSGFGSSSVKGRNRLPRPAAKTNACVISLTKRKSQRLLDFARNDKKNGESYGAAGDVIWNDKRRSCDRSLSQIKRARAEVDNPMVASQGFGSEQTGDGRRAFQQAIVN